MLDLASHHLAIVQSILRELLPGERVWAFGSRVSGSAKPHSDLDLVVMGERRLTLAELGEIEDAFAESDLPFRVDLVEWISTEEPIRQRILAGHEPVVADR